MCKRRLWGVVAALVFADTAIWFYLYQASFLFAAIYNVLTIITIIAVVTNSRYKNDTYKNELAEQKKLINVLINHIPCTIGAISPQYEILMVNNTLTKLLGVDEANVVGRRCFEVFGNGKVCPKCPVHRTLTSKKVQHNIKREHFVNGGKVFLWQTAVPIFNNDGSVKYVLEIGNNITQRVELEEEKNNTFFETVASLAKLIESRDKYTGAHSAKVQDIAVAIGRQMELDEEIINEIAIAAILHDIGKIGIPGAILNKAGRLTNEEYDIIKQHPQIGYDTLVNIAPLRKVATHVLHHHEWYDGSGYPGRKTGCDIPLVARVLSVADVYEAVTADRVYRKAMSIEQAIGVMYRGKGTQFDPVIVDALLGVLEKEGINIDQSITYSDATG